MAGCHDLALGRPRRLSEPAAVALEDYARTLSRAAHAEAIPASEPGWLAGVHVCGAASAPDASVERDLAAFARDLAGDKEEAAGLGWS